MKATGIVRRIDELGRIVIPKEIRKTLRIREGDSLEIYTNDSEDIVLKKYSIMNNIVEFAQNLTDSVYTFLKQDIIVTDTSEVIASSGDLKRDYIHKRISDNLINFINRRENMIEKYPKDIEIIENQTINATYSISTIVANGDAVGLVIILDKDNKIEDVSQNITQIAAQFLAKYLEE